MQTNADALVTEHLSRLFALVVRSHLPDSPVTRGDYTLLALAGKHGPARACELAEAGGLDQSTTSRRVSGLVERGLLARQPDPSDGRAQQIALTTSGRDVLAAGRAQRERLVATALEGWDEADRRSLAELLGRLQTSLARTAHDAERTTT
ncbi:winged helix-turn-helix transcriptional regulator [Phycicoccus endophyticus]|uniref:Winged helix-turn-helix transcriptional regulator n=1 Tax=Phycicoccus endophyticus TaxID=1690220 RepID=A0A7G9R2I8_9MICO|nr:MarR family winged helix-turn-helix transcriptional regulator [Phycicoccus endophyticus]NHI20729.1 winged helix-turn-helix transcriptional regulator [Phycicoccus endophyticus]QNN49813.1 winged helix-turn-helix transcriptional regulator [Phycicoccus endophyticus]GGL35349.1 hypothetical protein GCM10012283_17240 [Phycicoccus endophyticus]